MVQFTAPLYSLNAGIASRYALGRVDLAKMRITAEVQQNLMSRVLGPATFRPGTAYKFRTYSDLQPELVPFVFNASTKAMVEVTTDVARFIVDGVPVTRPAVTTTITNGEFTGSLAGWTDDDEVGAVSDWSSDRLQLVGTGTSFAKRYQEVTINEIGVEVAIRVVVSRGPVIFAVGTSSTGDNVIAETALRTGVHSLAFTPSVASVFVQVRSDSDAIRFVDSIDIEAAGILTIPHPWGSNYRNIRYAQSADVMFVACEDVQQQRIERRSQRSWSICDYNTLDGPFRPINAGTTTLDPGSLTGNGTITASRSLFRDGMEGALFRLTHTGQRQIATLTGDDEFSEPIEVTGVSTPPAANTRPFGIIVAGLTGTGTTVTLQRSFGVVGSWDDVEAYTTNQLKTFSDGFDNQIVFYRLGIKAGDYNSGSIDVTLRYASGSQQSVIRIINVVSTVLAGMEVLTTIGAPGETVLWEEGEWSDYRGFPSSVAFHDSRLWWGWKDRVFGSVSDNYTSYDDNTEGDSGPVVRSVATGPIEGIRWLLSLQRLLAGTASQEVSMRSSSFDEPITPTAFTARDFANRGCANIQAASVDGRAIYVQRNSGRIYAAGLDPNAQDFISTDLTRLVPDLLAAGVVDIAVQRQPDTRVWFVLADGTAAVLVFEPADEVVAWMTVVTDGLVKSVCVLPGTDEDEVYIAVQRTTSAGTIMAIEQFATFNQCIGGTLSRNSDSHTIYTGVATSALSGLTQLTGETVAIWADGAPRADGTVDTSGNLTLDDEYENVVVGRPYEGRFRSTKLAVGSQTGTAATKKKRIDHMALMMADVAWYGVRVGRSFTDMTGINPTLGNGRVLPTTEVLDDYDYEGSPFNGGWGPDERVHFSISSPYCATFMGLVIVMATNDPVAFGTKPAG